MTSVLNVNVAKRKSMVMLSTEYKEVLTTELLWVKANNNIIRKKQ